MICQRIREQLCAFLDGEVNGMQRKEISGHLESCDRCRTELDGLREIKRLERFLENPPRVAADEWNPCWQSIQARLGDGQGPGGLLDGFGSGFAWTGAIAASALGMVLSLLVPAFLATVPSDASTPSPRSSSATATAAPDPVPPAIPVYRPGAIAPVPVLRIEEAARPPLREVDTDRTTTEAF